MKEIIAVDGSMIQEQNAGIAYYALHLINHLAAMEDNEVHAFVSEQTPNRFNSRVITHVIPGQSNTLWHIRAFWQMKKLKPTVIVSPSNFVYGFLSAKTIQVVHDIAPLLYPKQFPKGAMWKYRLQLSLCVRRCKAIVTNSQTTAKDVQRVFPRYSSKVEVIGTGLNEWFDTTTSNTQVQNSKKKHIVSLGTLQPRKNYENAIRAFARVRYKNPDILYTIIGKKGWLYNDIYSLIKELKLEDSVNITGYLSEREVVEHMQYANLFINTSYWEGFGMPLIEAYALGVPIVASDIEVFREVMADKAIYCDPYDPDSIADAIEQGIKKDHYKPDQAFLDKYTWSRVVEQLMEVVSPE